MYRDGLIEVAQCGDAPIAILPGMANRHGLIAGATGTGKTTTVIAMAEAFSQAGVPVFLPDVKGDIAGISHSLPVTFWDIYGDPEDPYQGLPLRTTISEMGPTLLARMLDLTRVQEDILTIIFKIADDEGLLLIDTKDLRAMLGYVAEHAKDYSDDYGNMSKQSINVIQRGIVALEDAGGDRFFGEPALDIRDWFRTVTGEDGIARGMVNILDGSDVIKNPKLYVTFMLWMLSELFEILPEVGDLAKPRLVFFFDEAHLLMDIASKPLLQKLEQMVKLIRSKGIGIYFITQSPKDIPDGILNQLGNKVQHALHAYTPNEQKAIKAVADSFRNNPDFDIKATVQELGIGEALISFIQADGTPAVVQRAKVMLPEAQAGAIDAADRQQQINACEMYLKYGGDMIDRDSAYEFLNRKSIAAAQAQEEAEAEKQRQKEAEAAEKQRQKEAEAAEKQRLKEEAAAEKQRQKEQERAEREAEKQRQKAAQARANAGKKLISSTARTAGGTIGRELGNTMGSTIGGSFGKKLGGNVGASIGRGLFGNLFGK